MSWNRDIGIWLQMKLNSLGWWWDLPTCTWIARGNFLRNDFEKPPEHQIIWAVCILIPHLLHYHCSAQIEILEYIKNTWKYLNRHHHWILCRRPGSLSGNTVRLLTIRKVHQLLAQFLWKAANLSIICASSHSSISLWHWLMREIY